MVIAAPEPPSFDKNVRQPGLSAIAELVGEQPLLRRKGRRRRKIAERREDLKPADFPDFWSQETPNLLAAYGRICAYSCLYIHPVVGVASVDHWSPKSFDYRYVYEWDNYRLACLVMNARKGQATNLVDPFEVVDGSFEIDLVMLRVIPGRTAGAQLPLIQATIALLGLDHSGHSEALADYYHHYVDGHITFEYLKKHAPFLAMEMMRQNHRLPGALVHRQLTWEEQMLE